MERLHGKKIYDFREFSTLYEMLKQSESLYGRQIAYQFRRKPRGKLLLRSYSELLSDIEDFGTALLDLGLHQSYVALAGVNSYEWSVSYQAVINGVGVIVPLDKMLPENEMYALLERSRAKAFIVTPALLDFAMRAKSTLPQLEFVICKEQVQAGTSDLASKPEEGFYLFSDLVKRGALLRQAGDKRYQEALASMDTKALAVLLFTSGTTDQSKGVMLSQHNLVSNIRSGLSNIKMYPGERALSVLPLHHCFEGTVGMSCLLACGGCICFADGLRYLAENLIEWKINILLGVPLLFENIYKRIEEGIEKKGKAGVVKFMRPIGRGLAKAGFSTNRKLFRSVLEGLGGELRLVVAGAAAMSKEVHQAFIDFGVSFYQGYGLSESSPVVAACNDQVNVPGTIGQPLYGIEVAIDNEKNGEVGEILTRSESVMMGYFEDEAMTKACIDEEGWLHTGDMGYIDHHQCIVITGRCKSVIVLTNGKNVFPEEMEQLLNQIPGVQESMVFGYENERGIIDICCKFQLDPQKLPVDAKEDALIANYLQVEIYKVNQQIPAYKTIKHFIYSEEPFIRTTTMKVKRFVEQEQIQAWLVAKGQPLRKLSGSRQA